MNIRPIIASALIAVIKLLDFVVPKDKRLLLFGSHATKYVGGNSKALFDFVRSLDSTPFYCYFVSTHPTDDYAYLHPRSFRFLKVFLRAKTILVTHGLGDMGRVRPSRRKNVIFLWHGQGPKADGFASRRFTAVKLRKLDDMMRGVTAFLTCSRLDSYIRAYDHALHPMQIQPLGFPRCDFLTDNTLWEERIPSLLNNLPDYEKVVLYAITWRSDGEGTFFPFDDFDVGGLEEWSASHGILLLVRPHVNDNTVIEETLHVRNISFEVLNDVMKILPEVDLLITDYSSIQTDFLLLDRPIIYVPYDLDEFQEREGLCYPDYDFWTPGEKVHSFKEMEKAIERGLEGNDGYAGQRRRVNGLVNEFQKPGASKRVYVYLKQLLGFKVH